MFVVVVQLLLFETPWTAVHNASLLFTISKSFLKLMSIESVMPSNHLILCHPLLFLPSVFPGIRVFSKELALHIRWPKFWNFSFSISPSTEYSGLVSFRVDWFELLIVQGTLKSLLNLGFGFCSACSQRICLSYSTAYWMLFHYLRFCFHNSIKDQSEFTISMFN